MFCEVSVVAYEVHSLLIFAAYKLFKSIIYCGIINFTTDEYFKIDVNVFTEFEFRSLIYLVSNFLERESS